MEEKELIQKNIQSLHQSIAFFSNSNKSKREIWIVNEFLTNLGIEFMKDELRPLAEDPPDVIFRDAKFETKEIQDKSRKRHDSYKQKLEKAKSATRLKDLMTLYTPKDISLQEIVEKIHNELKEFLYSIDFCKSTDMLFYINLLTYSLSKKHSFTLIEEDIWKRWRSISMVTNNACCVLWADKNAPDFIKSATGKVIIRGNRKIPTHSSGR